jgi:hypothetical protein
MAAFSNTLLFCFGFWLNHETNRFTLVNAVREVSTIDSDDQMHTEVKVYLKGIPA